MTTNEKRMLRPTWAWLYLRLRQLALTAFLRPLDLVLRFLGPRYKLYLWFFIVAPPGLMRWLGRLLAERAVYQAAVRVPAYRRFLHERLPAPGALRLEDVPETDKDNYVKAFPTEDRCLEGRFLQADTAIDESSGSTGQPYNWVRSMAERKVSHLSVSHFARYCLGDEPWITINAFSMGAWATGVNMGAALQRNGVVKSTGPDMEKIIHTLKFFGPRYRYLICGYPPFLKHFIDVASAQQFPWEQYRLDAMVGGEGMSEGLRDYLYRRFESVYSGYGATDLEIGIAGETPLSVAIRRRARESEALRQALFGRDSRLPMLFQYNPLMHHIEVNEGNELTFTISRLNVLSPRIRYNIHDEGGVASFEEIARRCASAGFRLEDLMSAGSPRPVPMPFLWVYGRSDSTISVMGANIYPEDLEQSLYEEPDLAAVTHSFCISLSESENGSVCPCFSFEVTAPITQELQEMFRERILHRLIAINLDFKEAWNEYPETLVPEIRLYGKGEGPFQRDSGQIKQARLIKGSSQLTATPAQRYGGQEKRRLTMSTASAKVLALDHGSRPSSDIEKAQGASPGADKG
ncbi:MAG: phenylacetate--CoA ligase family protein [Dehalococcoidia bacterium]